MFKCFSKLLTAVEVMIMLYLAKCKSCNHLTVSEDILNVKSSLASHLNKSHGGDFIFVVDIPLSDFQDSFTISRIRDAETIRWIRLAMKNNALWDFFRNASRYAEGLPKSQSFSV